MPEIPGLRSMKSSKKGKLIIVTLGFLLLFPLLVTAQGQDNSKADEFYRAGNNSIESGDYSKAIENFTKAIDLNPKDARYFYNRSIGYRYTRRYDLAISDVDKTLELSPNLPNPTLAEVYYTKGTLYQEKGDYEKALDFLNRAVLLDFRRAEFFNNRANTYRFLKNYDKALADFDRSLQIKEYALTYYNRGALHDEKGDNDGAISDYSRAIELSPTYAEAFNNRGLSFQKKGSFDLALQDFAKAISINQKDGVYYFNRANIYSKKSNYSLAVEDYTRAVVIFPFWAEAFRRRAEAYKKLGKVRLADMDLKKAKEVEKENFSPVNRIELMRP